MRKLRYCRSGGANYTRLKTLKGLGADFMSYTPCHATPIPITEILKFPFPRSLPRLQFCVREEEMTVSVA